jgi:hypothetical protein
MLTAPALTVATSAAPLRLASGQRQAREQASASRARATTDRNQGAVDRPSDETADDGLADEKLMDERLADERLSSSSSGDDVGVESEPS